MPDEDIRIRPTIKPTAGTTPVGPRGAAIDRVFTTETRDLALRRIIARPATDLPAITAEKAGLVQALRPEAKRFHGVKTPIAWFPAFMWRTPCSDKYGYLTPVAVRTATKLPFTAANRTLLQQLGDFMADASRPSADSNIPAGYTYFGQFVDHDVTLDISSTLDAETDATTLNNMRSPVLDLDSVYGRGPALDPFLYKFPASGPPTAIRMLLGANTAAGKGGPGGGGGFGAMGTPTTSDLPRAPGTNTALLGDPRNDENLIVSQFHQTMLRFHNQIVDGLAGIGFTGDIFVEAKRIVRFNYQWAIVNDYLRRICGKPAVDAALASVAAAPNSAFAMPVEFAVAAYRFGHSMIRETYWVNQTQIGASLGQVFSFARAPNLPVLSNWVVDFNAFFDTGLQAAVHNKAKQIDSMLSPGLDTLPGFSGLMAMLATRNLLRGMALGLPSGQGVAGHFGAPALTAAQLKQGLSAAEGALLDASGGTLLTKTPLWYYVLREAAVLNGGNQLGPVGARIVAETFVRMLKRDPDSYLNATGGFAPTLTSAVAGDFTVADLCNFAKVTAP